MKSKNNGKGENFLDLIVDRNHENYEELDGRIHLIFIHKNPVQRFLRWMTKKKMTSTLELDNLGSIIWKNSDGKNTVYDLINILLDKEEDTYESMQERVIIYLRTLRNRKLIKLRRVII